MLSGALTGRSFLRVKSYIWRPGWSCDGEASLYTMTKCFTCELTAWKQQKKKTGTNITRSSSCSLWFCPIVPRLLLPFLPLRGLIIKRVEPSVSVGSLNNIYCLISHTSWCWRGCEWCEISLFKALLLLWRVLDRKKKKDSLTIAGLHCLFQRGTMEALMKEWWHERG